MLLACKNGCARRPASPQDNWYEEEPGSPTDATTGLPQRVRERKTGMRMVLVSPGVVVTEATEDAPSVRVAVSRPFYIGVFEVTEADWYAVMGSRSHGTRHGALFPIAHVSYGEITKFLAETGHRLPTSVEWEYACRAGSAGPAYGPVDDIAWHERNSNNPADSPYEGQHAHPVGRKRPNALRLYDTLGNVWEICADRRTRGGSYDDTRESSNAWFEGAIAPGHRDERYGFRVVRDPRAAD